MIVFFVILKTLHGTNIHEFCPKSAIINSTKINYFRIEVFLPSNKNTI